ncbi:PREDICTED: AT-rich interactive domain-containing protein 1 isoform X1 [Tarenaya hassleriana]|uniref:AT-rich interactive domain-containing protein 1 isoform X1 n=2 Tax=Tarenaya hassleriana TaxID=28532 RepID=UPI0008FD745C|nr:PREDICTED: AT-rich interactive domain-containing protein 1 isoform X1 [Tarenaya hassleriana]XP_019058517.1 PREDICTED: AT-rich interactive domain-containing protein 1 isoform X1 [Tarenaya hassleriana]
MGSMYVYRTSCSNSMAGWSTVAEENTVGRCKTSKKLSDCSNPHLKGSAVEGEIEKIVLLFRRLLEAFLEEFCSVGSFRPLPPMTGDGKTVDLFKLFLNVSDKGGFDAVSKNGLWGNVAQDSGLGLNDSASAKLMYVKYLDAFGRWLNRVVSVEPDYSGLELSGISVKLETELKSFLSEIKRKYGQGKGGNSEESGTGLKCFISEMKRRYDKYHTDKESVSIDAVKKVEELETAVSEKVVFHDQELEGSPCSGKRKRECTSEMLKWLTNVARDPCDPAIGPLPERSKWASYGNEEPWKRFLLFRAAMLQKRHTDSPSGKHWETHQKMHPYMYEDSIGPGYNLRERLSFSGSSVNERKAAKLEICSDNDSSMENSDEESDIPVGSDYQAEVPEWTGSVVSESDLKWLGTRVWPLDKVQNPRLLIERDPIGKGRQDSCGCERPGSVECVRFHVSEKRVKLKLELGSAFSGWGFDEMGEATMQIWTSLEQKKINAMIRTPPLLDQLFFEQVGKILPTKNRAKIVSYYYNVILLQYRAKQNRGIPCVIDSDPDEPDCESASDNSAPAASKSGKPLLLSPKKPNRQAR